MSVEHTTLLLKKTSFAIQGAASEIHESRRIPDPYVFLINGKGQLTLPSGDVVEKSIDTQSIIGQREMLAFQQIQKWATNPYSEKCIWFSPPYREIYPSSKIIISEPIDLNGQNGLLNRAVILDINGDYLLRLANINTAGITFSSSEGLRSTPLFLSNEEFGNWFNELEKITEQTKLIKIGQDILIKGDTIITIEELQSSVEVYAAQGSRHSFMEISRLAQEKNLYGENSRSCPVLLKTAFQTLFENSIGIDSKYVKNCGKCKRVIEKKIKKGYLCVCGGTYEGC